MERLFRGLTRPLGGNRSIRRKATTLDKLFTEMSYQSEMKIQEAYYSMLLDKVLPWQMGFNTNSVTY